MSMTTVRMLVSVRSVEEALLVAEGGAHFIDLKEPSAGALGGLPVATIRAIVTALRERDISVPVSATIGDLAMDDVPAILERVRAVGACGVDYVKVGITRCDGALAVLTALAACSVEIGHAVVPVFIADQGLDTALVERACALRFPAMMADTADKRAGSLFDAVSLPDLQRFVAQVRRSGALVGLAGALRFPHVPALQALAPDFAGFRTAVCATDRTGTLDPSLLHKLVVTLRLTSPSSSGRGLG